MKSFRAYRKNIDVDEVVKLYRSGMSISRIAQQFDTQFVTIQLRLERSCEEFRNSRKKAFPVRDSNDPAKLVEIMGGISSETRAVFLGATKALRNIGHSDQAAEIERDFARLDELAKKYRFIVCTGDADDAAPARS